MADKEDKKDNPNLLEISDGLYCEVSEYRGKIRVDIRKWYLDMTDQDLKRTRKGINLI